VDLGSRYTHIVPVIDGIVVDSSIRRLGIGGYHVTSFLRECISDRRETYILPDFKNEVALKIQHEQSYCCKNVVEEYEKWFPKGGLPPENKSKVKGISGPVPPRYRMKSPGGQDAYYCDVGTERFMGPEIYFSPELFHKHLEKANNQVQPLPTAIDEVIQSCPIDYKRRLYENVVLTGGSAQFIHFGNRVKRELSNIIEERREANQVHKTFSKDASFSTQQNNSNAVSSSLGPPPSSLNAGGGGINAAPTNNVVTGLVKGTKIDVNVVPKANRLGTSTVWAGGQVLASLPSFPKMCISKEEYAEFGTAILFDKRDR